MRVEILREGWGRKGGVYVTTLACSLVRVTHGTIALIVNGSSLRAPGSISAKAAERLYFSS